MSTSRTNPLTAGTHPNSRKPNRLINEKSPYLLQHAYNPVDWFPWGEEAFEKARKENKPIFLSIGYSTCYWCHVMEREVFENDSLAGMMNNYVVAVKVDREERPDIDRIYMSAVQAMTGSGGWPMSVFLNHDLKPFWGGTYIPPTPKFGRISFPELLTRINELWTTDPQKITEAGNSLTQFLQESTIQKSESLNIGTETLDSAFSIFQQQFDKRYGGFNDAPKFPRPVVFNFLFRYYKQTKNPEALEMCLKSLREMWRGGMYDHIGGGFHRYSTDALWRVPHFEKMLYDQAQLVVSYLEAYQISHDEFFADVARDILTYVERVMTSPEGAWYSAEDAESAFNVEHPNEKEEGEWYVWKKSDINALLGENGELLCAYFGIEERGNAPSDPQRVFIDKNILYEAITPETLAVQFHKSIDDVKHIIADGKQKLFTVREKKPKPHLDDKILVSWNGLMISAFAKAYQVLDDKQYLRAAQKSASFILKKLYNPDTKALLRRYRQGDANIEATLEDYAFLIQGLIDLYESSFDIEMLKTAAELQKEEIDKFYDVENGGFFDTSGKDSSLLFRTKEGYDGAEPSGNSIAILNLFRLSQMLDKPDWRAFGEKSLFHFGKQIWTTPNALVQFLVAVDFSCSPAQEIIIAGNPADDDTKALLEVIYNRFLPNKVLLLADGGEGQQFLSNQNTFFESVSTVKGKPTAYVCNNFVCELPVTERHKLAKLFEK